MKYTLTLFLLVFSIVSYASGTVPDDERCAQIYVSVSKEDGKLTATETGVFLNAIGCEYFSTAEGGEFGSELIMIVLENSTNEFIMEFDKLNPLLQNVILAEVRSPIHDGFNLQNIYNNIVNTNTSSPTRQILLAAIKQVAKGQGTEIK